MGLTTHGGTVPIDLLAFLTMGLLGSAAHCVGMCGPFVLIVSRRYGPPHGRLSTGAAQAWYTLGRLTTYAALGAAAAAFGGLVQAAGALVGLRRTAAVVAGLVLVLWAVTRLASAATRLPMGWMGRLTGALGKRAPGHPFGTGLLLGLLPCGLLYTAVAAAMARDGAAAGAAALVAFGVGTAPALLGLSATDRLFVQRRAAVDRMSQAFVLAMGLWYVWRGVAPLAMH
ncbi:MAG: sulfite exporter TauE/SafE family protein [Vicinamibacterales bacterium]